MLHKSIVHNHKPKPILGKKKSLYDKFIKSNSNIDFEIDKSKLYASCQKVARNIFSYLEKNKDEVFKFIVENKSSIKELNDFYSKLPEPFKDRGLSFMIQLECIIKLKKIIANNNMGALLVNEFIKHFFLAKVEMEEKEAALISGFFEPGTSLNYRKTKDDVYEKFCTATVLQLTKFFEVYHHKEGYFDCIIMVLSKLYSAYKSDKNYAKIKTEDLLLKALSAAVHHTYSNADIGQYHEIYGNIIKIANNYSCRRKEHTFDDVDFITETNIKVSKYHKSNKTIESIVKFKMPFDEKFTEFVITKIELLNAPMLPDYLAGKCDSRVKEKKGAIIVHTDFMVYYKAAKILSYFFTLCLKPTNDIQNKLREIATFEWLFQQVSPFSRGTPTIAKILISAILLKHGIAPKYKCAHNDMNCFLAFTSTLSEYLREWSKYTPYADSGILLIDDKKSQSTKKIIAKPMNIIFFKKISVKNYTAQDIKGKGITPDTIIFTKK